MTPVSVAAQTEFDGSLGVGIVYGNLGNEANVICANAQVSINGETASLLFQKLVVVPSELRQLLISRSAPERTLNEGNFVYWRTDSIENPSTIEHVTSNASTFTAKSTFPNVKRALINLAFPKIVASEGEVYTVHMLLIPCISVVCRKIFPHLDPQESAFNVRIGLQHYRADSQLSPYAKSNTIHLDPK